MNPEEFFKAVSYIDIMAPQNYITRRELENVESFWAQPDSTWFAGMLKFDPYRAWKEKPATSSTGRYELDQKSPLWVNVVGEMKKPYENGRFDDSKPWPYKKPEADK